MLPRDVSGERRRDARVPQTVNDVNTGALARLLLPLLIVLLAGCGSFQKEWERAGKVPSRDPFAGQWEGRWTSAKHKNAGGSLRCVLKKVDERRYHGTFRAGWLAFHGTYSAEFSAQPKGRELRFTGDRDLGPL